MKLYGCVYRVLQKGGRVAWGVYEVCVWYAWGLTHRDNWKQHCMTIRRMRGADTQRQLEVYVGLTHRDTNGTLRVIQGEYRREYRK